MTNQHKQELLLKMCQTLIQNKSYSGEEGGVAEAVKEMFQSLGYDDVKTDEYGNVIGRIIGEKPGPVVLFDGHIDTVPVNQENWTVPPFEGLVKDGKLYGRGATDMKGAVACAIAAGASFAEANGRAFAGEIAVSCSVHEECFEGVATRKVSEAIKPDVVIIGEASGLTIKHGQRGRAEIVVETFGKPAHSSNPDEGINAVNQMMKLTGKISELPKPTHSVLGEGILELTDIKSAPYPGASVVPHYCKVTYDRRTLVNETKESILAPIQQIIDEFSAKDPNFKAKVSFATGEAKCYTGNLIKAERYFPAWLLDPEDPLIQALRDSLKSKGFSENLSHYAFCTNGSHFAGEAGIKTIGFGPSIETLAHTDDEYIELEALYSAFEGYIAIFETLCLQEIATLKGGQLYV
ncbi:putative selenium metabolism hydrolase [Bhargavaea beijingensis]|uniref:Putative selenium metabolism hydrolase n=1 Tax=Bhargavaea beijingensis TaxID=426756 RepID=A0A1G7FTA6_9BACL|nr:YgeY family selenium metabolism-linked hydrolase [Bhargavaea beijingensis]SDE79111.1 putative selenium metabolism hydrolase [Bhargavaea beijingensis]